MWTTLGLVWKASGLNKLWPYLAVGLIVTASLVVAYTQGRSAGSASAKGKQLEDSLKRLQREAEARAEIQSIDSSIARKRLRERWTQN